MNNSENEKQKLPLFHLTEKFPDAKTIFSTFVPPLEECKDSALIVLDTNVLLLPYEIPPKNLNEIANTYKLLLKQNRVFIPSQVVREFAKIRGEKIKNLYHNISLKQNLSVRIESYKLLESETNYKDLIKEEEALNQKINEYRKTVSKVLETIRSWHWNDPISSLYRELFTHEIIVDLKMTPDEVEKDLNRRLANRISPGFKDASKDDKGIGDVIIWNTILQLGKEQKRPIIFVTGEEKTDWMLKSSKETLYPNFELIEEFIRASDGAAFHILKFSELLDLFGVETEVIKEVKKEELEIGQNISRKYVVNSVFENDSSLKSILAKAFTELQRKYSITYRKIFENYDFMEEVEAILIKEGYKVELLIDEETKLVELEIQLADRTFMLFDWELFRSPEFRLAIFSYS
jgi:rRNA-processing protein FCF1